MWVTIVPEPGNVKALAKRLLELSEHPSQVRTVTYPSFGYEVPGHVFLRFEESGGLDDVAPEPVTPKVFTDGDTDRGALEKRERARRGRPRKAAEKAEEE